MPARSSGNVDLLEEGVALGTGGPEQELTGSPDSGGTGRGRGLPRRQRGRKASDDPHGGAGDHATASSLRVAPGDHFVLVLSSDYDGGDLIPSVGTTITTTTTSTSAPPTTTTTQAPTADTGTNTVADRSQSGYWALASDGRVYSFGDATPPQGDSAGGAVDLEPTPSGKGYWTLNTNGRVQAFGAAASLGDVEMGKLAKGETPASLSATPSGKGYWVFTNRGRAIPFGDAPFLGDVSDVKLNGPVLGSVATPSGKGYYMVASDGGIFAFDAPFRGSLGGVKLNKPVVGMVGADGGMFNFSNLPFSGSLGDKPPASPVVAVAALPAA